MVENLSFEDKSIAALEKSLYDNLIVTKPLEGDQNLSITKRRQWTWILKQVFMALAMVRYILLATAHEENSISKILGDTFRNFGSMPRTVFYAAIVGQGSFAVGFNLITHLFEKDNKLDYLNDMKRLEGLSKENYRIFKMLSNLYALFVPIAIHSIQLLYAVLYFYGIHQGSLKANNGLGYTPQEFLTFIPAVLLLYLSGRYICPAFLLGTSFLTLSTLYLVMRFNQINELLDQVLTTESLEKNLSLMKFHIETHAKLSVKTFKYNKVIKWYLLVAHYTFGGVLAMVIFTLLAAPVPSIYIATYLILNVIVTGSLILIICGSASMIHATTSKSYHKLNLIYVAYGKFYDHSTRNQLIRLIESISNSNKPISFYCHDIFPFKKSSLIDIFSQIIVMVLLLVKTFVFNS